MDGTAVKRELAVQIFDSEGKLVRTVILDDPREAFVAAYNQFPANQQAGRTAVAV